MNRKEGVRTRLDAWWDDVLAGETDEPHPIHGDRIAVRLDGERLVLSGTLDTQEERDAVVRQARARIGRGFGQVDHSRLAVVDRHEKKGLLEQTLVAAYPDRSTAELARKFVLEHSQVKPRQDAIIDRAGHPRLREMLAGDYAGDARARLAGGDALLILTVDETAAFKVRQLLEEETRSTWTVAVPPRVIR